MELPRFIFESFIQHLQGNGRKRAGRSVGMVRYPQACNGPRMVLGAGQPCLFCGRRSRERGNTAGRVGRRVARSVLLANGIPARAMNVTSTLEAPLMSNGGVRRDK